MQKKAENVKHCFQKRLCFIGFNLVLSLFLLFVCRFNSHYATRLDGIIGEPLRALFSAVSSAFDFSVSERIFLLSPIIILLIFLFAFFYASSLRRAAAFLLLLVSVFSAFFSVYTFSYGIAYRKEPFYLDMEIPKTEISEEGLYSATLSVLTGISDSDFSREGEEMPLSLSVLEAELSESYERCFGKKMPPRRLKLSENGLLPRLGLSGLYFPLLAEISINSEMPGYNIPSTAAHELGHSLGIAREGEAGFFAFLLCVNSDEPYIRYSGYLLAYEHLSSALWRQSPKLYREAVKLLSQSAREDILRDREYRQDTEDSGAAKLLDGVREAHIAASAGKDSGYSFLTELLVAYYRDR